MNRRVFLFACTASAWAGQRRDVSHSAFPYPEQQHPHSARGREIAGFARTLTIERGIPYARRPEIELTLDVYSPARRPPSPLPCVLAFGLSGFRINETQYRWDLDHLPPAPTPNLYPPILARRRVVVVANLRVSAQAMFPAQIHDAKCALRWVRTHARRLGIDPERIGLFGASASGSLVSLLALTAAKGQLDDPSCRPGVSTQVKAVCSMSGIYDFTYYEKKDSGNGSLFLDVIPPYLGRDDRLYGQASPANYVHPGAPPFFLIHGLQDRRVPYSQMPYFAALLRKAGITVETESINNYQHGPLPGREPDPGYPATDANIYRFFARYLDTA